MQPVEHVLAAAEISVVDADRVGSSRRADVAEQAVRAFREHLAIGIGQHQNGIQLRTNYRGQYL